MSLAVLIYSTGRCVGPKVATRHFENVKVSGLTKDDVVEIRLDGTESIFLQGEDRTIPLPAPKPDAVVAHHKKASGNPVTVELV